MRGKRALLLEKDDFGGATSLNHLRTIHGGLRYLQSLDLPRFFESVGERRWFLTNFPALVQVAALPDAPVRPGTQTPGHHARRPCCSTISWGSARNSGVGGSQAPAAGATGSTGASRRELFPRSTARACKAGALWYDAAMPEHQRLLMEILRWACALGATALNYVQAESLLLHNGQVRGVLATRPASAAAPEFRAPSSSTPPVPGAGSWRRSSTGTYPRLFRKRLLLFNILFKRKALSAHALALIPPSRPQRTYFIHNWKNRMLAGTAEVLLATDAASRGAAAGADRRFHRRHERGGSRTVAGRKRHRARLRRHPAGQAAGKLAGREVIIRHGDHQRPERAVQRFRGQVYHRRAWWPKKPCAASSPGRGRRRRRLRPPAGQFRARLFRLRVDGRRSRSRKPPLTSQ